MNKNYMRLIDIAKEMVELLGQPASEDNKSALDLLTAEFDKLLEIVKAEIEAE